MSDGRKTSWTPERRHRHAAMMRKRWRDPGYRRRQERERRERWRNAPASLRAAARARCKRMLIARLNNEKAYGRWLAGITRGWRSPSRRAMQAAVFSEIMGRPESRARARRHAQRINRNPQTRKRQWATRRRKYGPRGSRPARARAVMES